MAKVTANGKRKLAEARTDDGTRYVLRSDGAILVAWITGDSLTVLGKIKGTHAAPRTEAAYLGAFRRFCSKRKAVVV